MKNKKIPNPKFKCNNIIIIDTKIIIQCENLFNCYNCNMKLLIQNLNGKLVCPNCNNEIEINKNFKKLQKIIIREKNKGKKLNEITKYLKNIGFKEKDFKTIIKNIFNIEND